MTLYKFNHMPLLKIKKRKKEKANNQPGKKKITEV